VTETYGPVRGNRRKPGTDKGGWDKKGSRGVVKGEKKETDEDVSKRRKEERKSGTEISGNEKGEKKTA